MSKPVQFLAAVAILAVAGFACWRLAVTSPQWQERHPTTEGTQTCQQ